jgi:FKBP-type peptidyl-prolyl cis-trans isomerase 2
MPENPIPDKFIVTVVSGDFEADLEIPSQAAFGEIKSKLLEILEMLDEKKFRAGRECSLRYRGRTLADSETPASVGAFDGARLTVE